MSKLYYAVGVAVQMIVSKSLTQRSDHSLSLRHIQIAGESSDDGRCSFIRFRSRDLGRGVTGMDGDPERNNPGRISGVYGGNGLALDVDFRRNGHGAIFSLWASVNFGQKFKINYIMLPLHVS